MVVVVGESSKSTCSWQRKLTEGGRELEEDDIGFGDDQIGGRKRRNRSGGGGARREQATAAEKAPLSGKENK